MRKVAVTALLATWAACLWLALAPKEPATVTDDLTAAPNFVYAGDDPPVSPSQFNHADWVRAWDNKAYQEETIRLRVYGLGPYPDVPQCDKYKGVYWCTLPKLAQGYWTPALVFHPPGEPVTPEQQCAMDRDLDAMAKRYGTSYPLDLLGKTCPGGRL